MFCCEPGEEEASLGEESAPLAASMGSLPRVQTQSRFMNGAGSKPTLEPAPSLPLPLRGTLRHWAAPLCQDGYVWGKNTLSRNHSLVQHTDMATSRHQGGG